MEGGVDLVPFSNGTGAVAGSITPESSTAIRLNDFLCGEAFGVGHEQKC